MLDELIAWSVIDEILIFAIGCRPIKSATRTLLSLTEVEPRIVPDATATLLPETIGTTSTTSATTLPYVDDPTHPVTSTTLGFVDDPAHPITVTPVSSAIPPATTTTPLTDTPSSADAYDWIDSLSDDQIAYLLSLSDADLATVLFGATAPESPATLVAGLPPTDITPTLHGIEVGTSPPTTPAANPDVVHTVFHIDPNAPPPTATTLEFRDGQQGQGPLVTLAQNPVQAPQMTPEEALNRLQNQPQIVVVGSTPPVVQAAPPAVLLLSDPAIATIWAGGTLPGGNQMIYTQDPDGTLHPYITTSQLADMIARGNAASSGATSGWTFGATFGPTFSEIGNLIRYTPTLEADVVIWQLSQAIAISNSYNTVRNNSDENIVGSAILAGLGYVGAPVNDGLVHIGNQVSTIYNEQRNTGEHMVSSAITTFAYSVVSVVGLVDIHEAISGRAARSGNELTSNERWSRGFLGAGSFLLTLAPFAQGSRAASAVAGGTADTAAGRALIQAEARASLQAAQAERRAAALRGSERPNMVPERPAVPPGEGPVPRPEPAPPPAEAPVPPPAERPVPPPAERPVPPPAEAPVPPPAEAPVPPNQSQGRLPTRPQNPDVPAAPQNPQSRPITVDTPPGEYTFVQDSNGVIHIVPNGPHTHPGILGNGAPGAAAGEIVIGADGTIVEINNISFTFQHDGTVLQGVQESLESMGFTVRPNAQRPFTFE